MLLHTPLYLAYLILVFLGYWLIAPKTWRKAFLLLVSYLFYLSINWQFLAILICTTIAAYLIGLQIQRGYRARLLAWLSVALNLGALSFFKLNDFFIHYVDQALAALGLEGFLIGFRLLFPLGISFYTFQAISYTIEIYRGRIHPAKDFVDLALYLGFFPKLIAGPFVQPKNFLAQLERPSDRIEGERIKDSLELLILGLFKKIVIADSLASRSQVAFQAAALVSPVYSFPSPLFIQGFYLYAFQIYADFSGYTDIARASAALLGFDLPENFRQPYFAMTLVNFWNRWHMTLTQWFREYLFFPLSRALLTLTRRRQAAIIQVFSNLVTMIMIGLWHGVAWTFFLWGSWHGILLSLESLLNWKPSGRVRSFLSGLLTFHLVALGWVIFNSTNLETAGRFLKGLFAFEQMGWLPYYLPPIAFIALIVFGIDLVMVKDLKLIIGGKRVIAQLLIIAAVVILIGLQILELARGAEARPFIYGQF